MHHHLGHLDGRSLALAAHLQPMVVLVARRDCRSCLYLCTPLASSDQIRGCLSNPLEANELPKSGFRAHCSVSVLKVMRLLCDCSCSP